MISDTHEVWISGKPYHTQCADKVPEADDPQDPAIDEALASSVGEPASVPPDDMEVKSCRDHGSPFVTVLHKVNDAGVLLGPWKVFKDGCEESL